MVFRLREWIAVAIAFAVPLVVLLASVRTSVGFWDTADLQTVAWIGGIPYPTGFPGYVMIGWLWTHLLPVASVAARLNALSAFAIAVGAATVTALALLFDTFAIIAVLAGWTFAFAHTVWFRATYADVHPVGFAVAFVALALAARWARRGEPRAFVAGVVLAGVAVAIDNTTALILAGGVVVALARRPPLRALAGALAIAALVVVAAYAYLPLRSGYVTAHAVDPTLALGIPPGRPFWDDHHPSTPEGFRSLVAGTEWGPHETLLHAMRPSSFRAAADRFGEDMSIDLPPGVPFVALAGIAFLAADAPLAALGFAIAALLPALFGATYPAEADPERYAFALYAVAALGIAIAADRTVRAFGRELPERALAVVSILLALIILREGALAGDLFGARNNMAASELSARVAASTRGDAIVVARWDYATSLAYAAYVDRSLGKRIVVCGHTRDYEMAYARWMRDRQVAIVSDGPPQLREFRTRQISDGTPQVYEVRPR